MTRRVGLLCLVSSLVAACSESPQRGDGRTDLPVAGDLTRAEQLARLEVGASERGLLDQWARDHGLALDHRPTDQLPAFTATYYVDSVGGFDSNAGTSPGAAWKTLSKVNAQSLKPGSAVFFKGGSSWTGELTIKSSGTAAAPIVYSVYGGGARPIIRNPGAMLSHTVCVRVSGSYVIVEGFLLKEAAEAGVSIGSGTSHVIVRDVEATAVGFGVYLSGQQHLVTKSTFHDLIMVNNTEGGDDDYGAVGVVLADATSCEVSYNKMLNCEAPSYDYGNDGGVVEWWAGSSGNLVHHNWGEKSNGFIEVGGQGETVKDNLVAYNVSVNNGGFLGFHLGGKFGVTLESFRAENNTIYEPSSSAWELIYLDGSTPTSTTLLLRNNLFSASKAQSVTHVDGFTHENNLYHLTGSGSAVGFPLKSGEKQGDPLLADPAKGDLHLKAGSPAIDAGQNLKQTIDYDGHPLPCGSAPEIGAFEFGC